MRYSPTPRHAFGTGYTWFVRVSRITLPLVALVMIGMVIARLQKPNENLNVAHIPEAEKPTAGKVELIKATYQGKDAEGRNYSLTADHAERLTDEPDIIAFTHPKADVMLPEGWLAAEAKAGRYDVKKGLLFLQEGVHLFHDKGYEIRAENLHINLNNRTLTTTSPLHAQGKEGDLNAQGLEVQEEGQILIFKGAVSLTVRLGLQEKTHAP